MATEKSQASFLHTEQTPIEAGEETMIDPTAGRKSVPHTNSQLKELGLPPAYSKNSRSSTSEIPVTPTPPSRPAQLRKPIAIPAIDANFDSPFIRAYPPMLKDYKLPKESFLSFLDNLNQAVASSPPLQVLDAAGGILRLVPILFPLHWVGSAVSGIANLSSFGISKGRTEVAIRQANKDIFGPRGLKVEIAKLDALAYIAGIPILNSKGKINQQALLLQPLMMEANCEMDSLDVQQRLLKPLQPWIADLDLETLPWTSNSKLTRFNAVLKKQKGHCEKLEKKLISIAKERSKVQRKYDEVKKINEEYVAEDQEKAGIRKILWLVIRDIEADSGVVG